MIPMSVYQGHIEQLFTVLKRAADGLNAAGISYRLVGGLAVFFHVDARDPIAARFTRDIDLAVNRRDVEAIRRALAPCGFTFRHAAGVDMLLNSADPKASSAVHLLFVNEKVRESYSEAVPESPSVHGLVEGVAIAPVIDLVRMKLTSFRQKDQVHVRDMDAVQLITPEIENRLSPELTARLQQVRSTE